MPGFVFTNTESFVRKTCNLFDGTWFEGKDFPNCELDSPGTGARTIDGIFIELWKAAAMMRRTRSRFERSTRKDQPSQVERAGRVNNVLQPKNTNTKMGIMACKNKTYDVTDDVYVYGSMEFTSKQPWYIPKSSLTLLEEINAGRFARIYKASKRGNGARDIAAKVLKDQQNEQNHQLMMAKINFAATLVGEQRNVLAFVRAVFDNDALGPVLVMEYCENGQLDKWLSSRRTVDMAAMEKLQTFALEVTRGMEYLVKKGIVHRKLAARNCLFTFAHEVKIAGLGPCRMDEYCEDDNTRMDPTPVKWTAPECLKSMKEANERSDIWSYGVTLWEIFSLGETPYSDVRSRALPVKIQNGFRFSRPVYAEDIHYELMKSCWYGKPEQRPTFTMTNWRNHLVSDRYLVPSIITRNSF